MYNNYDYTIGTIHNSNRCGNYQIIEDFGTNNTKYSHAHLFKIKFLLTGYETIVTSKGINSTNIKDPYYPNILGIACFGIITDSKDTYHSMYRKWYNMLSRCYDTKFDRYSAYGAIGVRVCNRWLCFEYFYNDVKFLPGYEDYVQNPKEYQLDKDILQANIPKGQRIYSPETCMWVPARLNMYQQGVDKNGKNPYTGVYGYSDNRTTYRAVAYDHNRNFQIGVYESPEIAAAAYNNFISCRYPYLPLNNVLPITDKEAADYDLCKTKMMMVKIVK